MPEEQPGRNAIENGFTTQLTNRVTIKPFGRLPTFLIEAKSTFIIMGMIISQIRTAIGTLIWLPSPNSRFLNVSTSPGTQVPNATPMTMQSPTQILRYRSNKLSCFSTKYVSFKSLAISMVCLFLLMHL